MNKQYVAMAIKQILTDYGDEIISNHSKFKAVIYDFVNDTFYHEERLVIKHAMEAPAFWRLLSATSLTAEEAGKFVEQIIKENYMSREGANFIVECVAEARGGIKDDNPTDEIIKESDDSNNFPRNSDVGKEDIAEAIGLKCTMKMNGREKQRGQMFLYDDRMIFYPDTKNEQHGELLYSDISRIYQYQSLGGVLMFLSVVFYFLFICVLAGFDPDADVGIFVVFGSLILLVLGMCIINNTFKKIGVLTEKGLRINFRFNSGNDIKWVMDAIGK